jgi:tetratricopeptide (TPR) repeat protein
MRRGALSDLTSAAQRFGQLIDLSPPETSLSLQAAWRQQVAISHYEGFWRTRALDDLSECIRSYQEALVMVPKTSPHKKEIVSGLTAAFQARYRIIGEVSDLDRLTQLSEQAYDLAPKSYLSQLEHMAKTYKLAYETSGEMSDLDALIRNMERALLLTPSDDPKRTDKFEALGAEYSAKHLRTREVDDVTRAIQLFQESYNLTPSHYTLARTSRLHRLSLAHKDRHERTGSIVDLDAAIQNLRIVIRDTDNHHPERPRRLQSLGVGYGEKYQSSGGLADIDNAIKQFEEALALVADKDSLKASLSSALGTAYLDRHKRTQVPGDLDARIRMCQEAVKFPLKATDRADCLHLLAMGYSTRARNVGAESDLDEAIQLTKEALELTADSDPRRSRQFHTPSVCYQNRFSKTNNQGDLDMAI